MEVWMMRVSIYTDDGKRGLVFYDTSTKEVMVSHPDPSVRESVRMYLNNDVSFRMPMGQHRGAFVDIFEKPTESKSFLEMGLSQMYYTIGVHVDWTSEDNYGGSMDEYVPSNDSEDTLKSLDDFDFIN
jgi:hypothetical protein